ncbi:hypothetical protein ADIS_0171 [Lunatimonas lonarensis]|uniref:Uncharacterized protein n=1 Tax=Lunatimonas lonarensis TaxID=1232681 RepID=R7ZZ87_9BACT|nr:hypothetical protein ADIS_0171 [Lunatimonas lonarensis]
MAVHFPSRRDFSVRERKSLQKGLVLLGKNIHLGSSNYVVFLYCWN